MNRRWIVLVVITFLLIPTVFAKDISFAVDQSDYYFLTGEEAIINLDTENTYKKPINGLLSYVLTQEIFQQGFQYSSSNTQSTSFSVEEGENIIPLNFGTSDDPMTLTVNLIFTYCGKRNERK